MKITYKTGFTGSLITLLDVVSVINVPRVP